MWGVGRKSQERLRGQSRDLDPHYFHVNSPRPIIGIFSAHMYVQLGCLYI